MPGEDARKSGGEGRISLYIGFLAIGLVVGILSGIAIGTFVSPSAQTLSPGPQNVLTPEEAGEKAVDFIANYAVPPGIEVTLVNVTEVETENLYKVVVILSTLETSETRELYITKEGKLLFLSGIDLSKFAIGDFIVSGDTLCTEDGKPIIYFFGEDNCGFCKWEHPIIENVTAKFTGYISFHDNMNELDRDREIFNKYSPDNSIPTIVVGCTYYRVGAGTRVGEEQEEKILTALICTLTDNKPEDVCTDPEIKALINQIE